MTGKNQKQRLERLYKKYNRRQYVHPDPLEFLYAYKDVRDREIAGLVAASLAYGRVAQILASVSRVLDTMGSSPFSFVVGSSEALIGKAFKGFTHRFATGRTLSYMLIGVKRIIDHFGSLHGCFLSGYDRKDDTVLSGLNVFAARLIDACEKSPEHLLPLPERGSACKRLHLYLRWMVREDAVDPGGWAGIPAAKLIVPLDTHMHAFGRSAGFTDRRQADMRAAMEITEGFRKMMPDDPVKYDFVLTREGIWKNNGARGKRRGARGV
jgi:uncharacterized protein (TIGR02757 family)